MIRLRVWANDQPMGWFGHVEASYFFEYDPCWLVAADAFVLAPQFPLVAIRYKDQSVRNFFFNLLPEGVAYQDILNALHTPGASGFDLIGILGEESLGVLSIRPENKVPLSDQHVTPLPREALSKRINDRAFNKPLLLSNQQTSMSLPGAQDKLGLRFDPKKQAFFDTVGTTPSTHIAKPDTRLSNFTPSAINEYLIMRLAKALKLPIPEVHFLQVPESLFLVDRYDRRWEGDQVACLHQVDLCQVLDVGSDWKYQRQGGLVSYKLMVAALRRLRVPGTDLLALQRWVMFNYLVGNSDAHTKNVSVLISPRGYRLAPFYDLLSVQVYGDNRMALFIGDDEMFQAVGAHSWEAFCEDCGFGYKEMMKLLREMATKVGPTWGTVVGQTLAQFKLTDAEMNLIGKIREVIAINSDAVISMTSRGD